MLMLRRMEALEVHRLILVDGDIKDKGRKLTMVVYFRAGLGLLRRWKISILRT